MLKFSDLKYERPNIEDLEKKFGEFLNAFDNADSFEEQDDIIEKINSLRKEFEYMKTLVSIRHNQDVTDEFYQEAD